MAEIRPGAIIGRAFGIYRDQAPTLLGAALIVFGIQFLLALLLPRLLFIAGIAAFVLSVFYGGMVVNLVRDVQDGRRDHSMGELFRSVSPILLPLVGLAIVAGIGIAIGFVLIIIPGLILLTIWSVAAPVMVIEQPGVFAALGRSRDLVRGYGWPVFGTIVLAALIDLAVNIVASIVAAPLSDAGTAVVNWIAATLTAPVFALTAAALYFALLAVKEPAVEAAPGEAAPSADEPSPSADEPSPSADEPSPAADEPSPSADEPSSAADEPSPSADEPSPAADEPSPSADERPREM